MQIDYRQKIWSQEPDTFIQEVLQIGVLSGVAKIASGIIPFTSAWGVVTSNAVVEVRNFTLDLTACPSKGFGSNGDRTIDFTGCRVAFWAFAFRHRFGTKHTNFTISPIRTGYYTNAYRPWYDNGTPTSNPLPHDIGREDSDYLESFATSPTVDSNHRIIPFESAVLYATCGLFDMHYLIGGV